MRTATSVPAGEISPERLVGSRPDAVPSRAYEIPVLTPSAACR